MKNIKNIKASLFIVGAFFSMAAGAASFDCAKASSRVENAICASPTLSRLDSELADAYGVILLTNADAEGVKSAQRVWLRDTRNKCADDACLETVYKQRIAALRGPDPVDAPSREEIEADDANMPSDQELAEQEQKRLAEEQAAKVRADELAAKAQAEVAAKAKAEAEAAELAKKQKEEAETKKAVQARQQQLYIAIGVGVLFTVGFFGWLFLGKRKANPSTVNTSKSSSRNDQANQGDAQEALGRAQRELLHKQQAEIESLKAKLAKEAEIVSNGPSTQAASIQGVLSNVGESQEELKSKNQSSKIDWKEDAVDSLKNGVKNPYLVNLLNVLLAKLKGLSITKKVLLGVIFMVFLLIKFGPEGGESSQIAAKSSKITAGEYWSAMSVEQKNMTCKYYLLVSEQFLQELSMGGNLYNFSQNKWIPLSDSEIAPGANLVVKEILQNLPRCLVGVSRPWHRLTA